VGAFDESASTKGQRSAPDFVNAQRFNRDTRTHDVNNAVQRAYFVKRHVIGRLAVNPAFGFRQSRENFQAIGLDPCAET